MLHVHIYWYVFVQTVYVRKGVGLDGSDSTPMMHEYSPGRRQWLAFSVVQYICITVSFHPQDVQSNFIHLHTCMYL